jgi:nucleotide-binding universal stress UspA family protein
VKLGAIIVPLDGSTPAEAALTKALELAEMSGARVLLLWGAHAQTLPGVDPTEAQVKVVSEAEAYLAQVQKRLTRQSRVTVETSAWYDPAAHAIVEAARIHKVEEIVMTTHGRSGLGQLLLGSVTESVLRGTTTPVLVVHAEGTAIQVPIGHAKPSEAR